MTEAATKKVVKAAPVAKAAEVVKKAVKPSDVVKVKNISTKVISTSKGRIEPGKTGNATVAELRQLHKYLGKA